MTLIPSNLTDYRCTVMQEMNGLRISHGMKEADGEGL